ncbi:MAG: putative colanic acid biosynthesis acetyltransferase [Ferruginibacter sp.]
MDKDVNYVGTTFSLQNRIGRVLWAFVSGLFFQLSPKPFFEWRSFLLRCFGAKVGKAVHIYPNAKIWAPWNLEINDASAVASGAILYTQGKIIIGRNVVISQGSHLCAGTHDYNLPEFPLITMPIIVQDFAWIAAEAFVHPGVIIGKGSVVGARSVVTKDTPEWMVCAGHPCKPIGKRNDISIVNKQTLNVSK